MIGAMLIIALAAALAELTRHDLAKSVWLICCITVVIGAWDAFSWKIILGIPLAGSAIGFLLAVSFPVLKRGLTRMGHRKGVI